MHSAIYCKRYHFLHVRLANIRQIVTHRVGEGQTNSHFHIFSMAVKTDLTSVESTSAISGKIPVPFDPEIPRMRIVPITVFIIYDVSHKTGFAIASPHVLLQYVDFGNDLSICFVLGRARLCDRTDYTPPGFSVDGIFQTSLLEWVAISFSRESSPPRGRTCISCVSCTAEGFFTP